MTANLTRRGGKKLRNDVHTRDKPVETIAYSVGKEGSRKHPGSKLDFGD